MNVSIELETGERVIDALDGAIEIVWLEVGMPSTPDEESTLEVGCSSIVVAVALGRGVSIAVLTASLLVS